jgi:hypothetical protein
MTAFYEGAQPATALRPGYYELGASTPSAEKNTGLKTGRYKDLPQQIHQRKQEAEPLWDRDS